MYRSLPCLKNRCQLVGESYQRRTGVAVAQTLMSTGEEIIVGPTWSHAMLHGAVPGIEPSKLVLMPDARNKI